ncbi:MAG: mandelate racemase/muconate lactonizing enzyme family protein [Verrucomicrobia bacterium]|jgi:L-alanine-DL-glutamate epimerase-like enolase superfamily enzyme|nr:mandelate racemase/muconate lactonizing enzyme family protein [Verrucomicrobiota bacterium]MBT6099479.1 mandelate racemase/muconate lactonizing enzyme family protein [Marinovum sp.]MBT6526321.1 mandelate racemase/muconate lactonizing enzyme family protein [Marinovum sp.]
MARIAHIEIMMIDLPPKVIRTDAIQSFVSQETPIVRVTDVEGQTGTGYCYTIGSGGPAIISLLKETLAPRLIGREAEEIDGIWRDLLFSTHATAVGAITSLALAAIDTALWDLRCRRAALPLWQMAGGSKTSVPLYSTEGGWLHISTEDLVADAVAIKEAGFAGSKIKVGKPSIAEDRARLLAVREAVGDDFMIMVDANQSFSLAEALRRAKIFAEANIHWFEEPMSADDVGAHCELARHSSVPIAVGESLYSLSQFKDYLTHGAASIIQADVARIGGITPWLKAAHLAEAFNVPICPHFLMELHVSLVCAVPNAPMLEYIPQLDEVTHNPMVIREGHGIPSDEPGTGIDWNWDIVRARIVEGTHHQFAKEGT